MFYGKVLITFLWKPVDSYDNIAIIIGWNKSKLMLLPF